MLILRLFGGPPFLPLSATIPRPPLLCRPLSTAPNNSLEPTLTAGENGDSNAQWCCCRVCEGEPSAVGPLSSRPLGRS